MIRNEYNNISKKAVAKCVALLCVAFFLVGFTAFTVINGIVANQNQTTLAEEYDYLNLQQNTNGEYLISSADDLKTLSVAVQNNFDTAKLTFVLTDNINMSATSNFMPIGVSGNPFKGYFNGQGYEISNLSIAQKYSGDIGLFGTIKDATIINVSISSGLINQSNSNKSAGALVGVASGNFKIEGCKNTGCLITADKSVENVTLGGLIGSILTTNATASNLFNSAQIQNSCGGTAIGGGIVGNCNKLQVVSACQNNGQIIVGTSASTSAYSGGIIGLNTNTKVIDCLNSGSVSAYATKFVDSGKRECLTAYDKILSFEDTNRKFFLGLTTYKTLKIEYTDAYAGGICGTVDGSEFTDFALENCVNTSNNIVGGSYTTNATFEFIVSMNANAVGPTNSYEDFYAEKYTITLIEDISYAMDIARTNKSFKNCYSINRDAYLNSSAVSVNGEAQLYYSTVGTYTENGVESRGYVITPSKYNSASKYSYFADKGVTNSISKNYSSYFTSTKGLNFLQIATTTACGGDYAVNAPGFFDNYIKTTLTANNQERAFNIKFNHSYRYYTSNSTGSVYTQSINLNSIALPFASSLGTKLISGVMPTGLGSIWSISNENNYPTLSQFKNL